MEGIEMQSCAKINCIVKTNVYQGKIYLNRKHAGIMREYQN